MIIVKWFCAKLKWFHKFAYFKLKIMQHNCAAQDNLKIKDWYHFFFFKTDTPYYRTKESFRFLSIVKQEDVQDGCQDQLCANCDLNGKAYSNTHREQWWYSGESTRLSPMWPGFNFQSRCHMWVEFVGSLLYSERLFPGYSGFPLSSKNLHLIQFDLICTYDPTSFELWNPSC